MDFSRPLRPSFLQIFLQGPLNFEILIFLRFGFLEVSVCETEIFKTTKTSFFITFFGETSVFQKIFLRILRPPKENFISNILQTTLNQQI